MKLLYTKTLPEPYCTAVDLRENKINLSISAIDCRQLAGFSIQHKQFFFELPILSTSTVTLERLLLGQYQVGKTVNKGMISKGMLS
jgi:hypothetical protein